MQRFVVELQNEFLPMTAVVAVMKTKIIVKMTMMNSILLQEDDEQEEKSQNYPHDKKKGSSSTDDNYLNHDENSPLVGSTIRFSLPSSSEDSIAAEPSRDWRTFGAIDY